MNEKVENEIYNSGDVLVTDSRFVVSGQTYAINNVTSVRHTETKPTKALLVVLGLIGILIGMVAAQGPFNAVIAVVAVLWLAAFLLAFFRKSEFTVWISTAAGEARALSSKNKQYIADVVNALNDAIVQRS